MNNSDSPAGPANKSRTEQLLAKSHDYTGVNSQNEQVSNI